jgi:hypothetical protein
MDEVRLHHLCKDQHVFGAVHKLSASARVIGEMLGQGLGLEVGEHRANPVLE